MTEDDRKFSKAETLCLAAVDDPKLVPEYREAHLAASELEHKGWKKMSGETQHDKIMKHFKKAGSITVREAMIEYSISSLTKRIQELRERGENIVSTTKRHPVTQQTYVRYSLGEANAA